MVLTNLKRNTSDNNTSDKRDAVRCIVMHGTMYTMGTAVPVLTTAVHWY